MASYSCSFVNVEKTSAGLHLNNQSCGFTLIETMIVGVIAIVIAIAIGYVLRSSQRTSRIASADAQAQQNARVALDILARDIRSIGYGIDQGLGQQAIVYAGPFELIFNANIEPASDNSATPGYPAAINIDVEPQSVPPAGTALYSPSVTFTTGAETIRYTLDSNNDGVIDESDSGDDVIEQKGRGKVFTLIRQVYGYDGSTNGGESEQIALIRGPTRDQGEDTPYPLFTYWLDHDDNPSTPDLLWGDTSGDGLLDQSEIVSITHVNAPHLGKINRIGINPTGSAFGSLRRGDGGISEAFMKTEVSVRNTSSKSSYIVGVVFDDLDGDGTKDTGESGLSGVTIRLNTGATTLTVTEGYYSFRVDPGSYTVTEIDPVGYTSTTPNAVSVTVSKGSVAKVDFGDQAIGGYGTIHGMVMLYEQFAGGDPTPTGVGVEGVTIYLNTGERTTTMSDGTYSFFVPVSTYSVTMVVPPNYSPVGPTTVDCTIPGSGESVVANFGVIASSATGTIRGKVFLDNDGDGNLDAGESGIPSVTIRLSNGQSTLTAADGTYSFTVIPGIYDVTEEDLVGYESTTINNVTGVVVEAESTVVVNFGDRIATELSFTVITLGETQRALCITSGDLKEDGRGDPEIILGTKYVSGVSNLNVWFNQWKNQSTPNSAIFSQDPSYSRTPGEDIYSIDIGDLNGDGVDDIATGLTQSSGKVLLWFTQTSGSNKGKLPTTPNGFFLTTPAADVLALRIVNSDTDSDRDIIIGTEYTSYYGKIEVWFNNGTGTFTHDPTNDIYEWAGSTLLNAVRSIGYGNVGVSPSPDVTAGTASGINTGAVEIYRDNGFPNGKFAYYKRIPASGEVNAVVITDMLEDTNGDNDIIVGTKIGDGLGRIELWLNNGDGTYGYHDESGSYVPSDTLTINGEILCMAAAKFNGDVYPDLAVGIKRAGAYSGNLIVYQCFGYLPSNENAWISPDIGEAITLTVNDFNMDYKWDIAVGTRTSSSRGHVVVFFND
ncbi:MAG: SdrD B-like domain-containing protein [bacterium]